MSAELVQGSVEWHLARVGKVTASRMGDLTARTKTGFGAGRTNYLAELVAERLTGVPAESYQNAAMKWGCDTEPMARAAYQFLTDTEVSLVGFIDHPTIAMSGASPDGFAGEGLAEFKCPQTATHIETLLGGSVPKKYLLQMQWQMACTGKPWCDFASFDPRMPQHLRLFVRRLERDAAVILSLESEVVAFLAEVDATVAQLEAL